MPFHGFYEWAVIYSRIDSRETRTALEIIREEILKTTGEHSTSLSSPRIIYTYIHTYIYIYIGSEKRIRFCASVDGCKSAAFSWSNA